MQAADAQRGREIEEAARAIHTAMSDYWHVYRSWDEISEQWRETMRDAVRAALIRVMSERTGAEMIAAERRRQVEVEGWTSEHDDTHRNRELADAAIHFLGGALPGGGIAWPWPNEELPRVANRIHSLTRAGALIAAEIDRLQRDRRSDGRDGAVPEPRPQTPQPAEAAPDA